MKNLGVFAIAFTLLGASQPLPEGGVDVSTERRVHGVITSIEAANLSIASKQRTVTGKIDPLRTKVVVNGHAAKLADLKLTDHAKGELCLDDVWLVIDAH